MEPVMTTKKNSTDEYERNDYTDGLCTYKTPMCNANLNNVLKLFNIFISLYTGCNRCVSMPRGLFSI